MYIFLLCARDHDLPYVLSTSDIRKSGDNIVKSKSRDRMDRLEVTGIDQNEELVK